MEGFWSNLSYFTSPGDRDMILWFLKKQNKKTQIYTNKIGALRI